jgi:hypothetical protein
MVRNRCSLDGASGLRRIFVAITVGVISGIAAGGAQANGSARHDFRVFPRVGTPTTTFRVTFSAPFRTDGATVITPLRASDRDGALFCSSSRPGPRVAASASL